MLPGGSAVAAAPVIGTHLIAAAGRLVENKRLRKRVTTTRTNARGGVLSKYGWEARRLGTITVGSGGVRPATLIARLGLRHPSCRGVVGRRSAALRWCFDLYRAGKASPLARAHGSPRRTRVTTRALMMEPPPYVSSRGSFRDAFTTMFDLR